MIGMKPYSAAYDYDYSSLKVGAYRAAQIGAEEAFTTGDTEVHGGFAMISIPSDDMN